MRLHSKINVVSADAQRAEVEAETLRCWDDLYKSYKRYRRCDDGAIWEGYSESVARILVDHWATLSRFAQLAHKDQEFRRFGLKHVDETINGEDARTIRRNAEQLARTVYATCAMTS